MIQVSEDIVSARVGEELEKILRADTEFQQQTKVLHKASIDFRNGCGMKQEGWKLYDNFEQESSKYNCMYGEAAYRLGVSDGFLMSQEQKPDGRKLSLEDMNNLISIYDCVQKLKEILLGSREEYWEEGGGFTVFERLYNIIEHAACAEIRLLGEDEAFERVTAILDEKITAEERAKQLLGIT